VSARRWKRRLWCSRRCCGEVIPRPRLVGRAGTAPPCRPGMHLGDLVSLLFFLSTLWFSPRPWSPTMLVKTSEPSSQRLLCDAVAGCMFASISCDCTTPCDDLLAPPLPLSTPLLTEVLFLNLAHLQDSVNTWHMLTVLYSHS
jgi:hypothetical protein